MRSACLRAVGVAAVLAAGFEGRAQPDAGSMTAPAGEEWIWESVAEAYEEAFVEAGEAYELERLLLPWEESRAVTLALPLGEFFENGELGGIFYETLAALLPRVDVIAFTHRLDQRLWGDLLVRLEADERTAAYVDRLVLEVCDADSIWMRDFGPQFGLGKGGELVLIDPSVGDPGASLENFFQANASADPLERAYRTREESGVLKGMVGSDRVPALLSGLLQTRWGVETRLSRPPLYLQGGDFLPMDGRSALVSASTLRVNGGDVGRFEEVFEAYYGVDRLVVLETLPGKTIEHLDFILQPIGEKVVLMVETPAGMEGNRAYHRFLKRELAGRFERNEAAVRKAFPDTKILKVPMPPPILDSDEQVRRELCLAALQVFASRERLAMRLDRELVLANWAEFTINPVIEKRLLAAANLEEWKSVSGQERVIELFLGESFGRLLERHVEAQVSYRSYVNSLYVKASGGEELVLLPRFRPVDAGEAELLEEMEAEVSAVYAEACPRAELVWIDCTALEDFLGAIHCYSLAVPDVAAAIESK